jgi:hypothetical protein
MTQANEVHPKIKISAAMRLVTSSPAPPNRGGGRVFRRRLPYKHRVLYNAKPT